MSEIYLHSFTAMGTVVSMRVSGNADTPSRRRERDERVLGATEWFRRVEQVCSRFNPTSELSRLSAHVGTPVPLTALLFHAIEFALALAEETDGAFDPTVGRRMETRGFDRSWRTGQPMHSAIPADESVSFRDVQVDPQSQTITLTRPLLLDLGAVAKGLAIDLAARDLAPLKNFSIDAGGDVYVGGHDDDDEPWVVGVRHPREEGELIDTFRVTDAAVCTSGDYERRSADGGHHVLDPRTGAAAKVASASVIETSAMVADGLATAAMVLGTTEGLALLEGQGAEGLIVSTEMERFPTLGLRRYAMPLSMAAPPA